MTSPQLIELPKSVFVRSWAIAGLRLFPEEFRDWKSGSWRSIKVDLSGGQSYEFEEEEADECLKTLISACVIRSSPRLVRGACPFCGASHGLEAKDKGEEVFFVECVNCGATGPTANDEVSAWEFWKKRGFDAN